ncbi:phage tail tape measure protein [uncultured Bilophila sp.]|uniref:phage tail tape measure protein n=1 Tax=uncultured Bilophila sp. TaxID=529385 RepID=UPI002670A675|nr:phage tail tape measure protein [uncultured Bilophila sp.]
MTELGSMVNGVSQQLINFGKDSVNVYREYEKSMADAQVALSTTYGRGTQQLNTVMSQLDVAATEWAATTIFHTNDVANAISEAAHAGWDFDQIMSGIPAAMQLAQAGGLDLSEAVNYIVKSTNAAGIGFEDMGHFIDLWAFAANSSASTIGEFGDAMLRMGSTMRFAGNTEELMTLIAVTANAGSVGSEAGTMIRNSMMRLIAPTDKAGKAMAQLGATSTETAAILGDEALAAANAELAAHGFSAFYQDGPQKGQMKNVLDIYRELYVALGDIAGGYENIDRNGDALGVLSAIFPTRTITEALTLLRGAAEGYDGLYEAMRGGDAEGYGQYAAETMMDTLDGKIETFESKVERLKQLVGEELSGQVEQATGFIGGLVDSLAAMDSDNLGALVTGLEVIAAAGPGLMLAGGAFRMIGYLLTPAGGIGMGLIALTAAAAAIKQLEEADFAKNFGNLELDTQGIQSYVKSLGDDFKAAYTEVDGFKTALDNAVTSYQTASSTFSSTLFQDMITNTKLTEADKQQLQQLGIDMYTAVQEAITNSTAASMSYWQTLFGGDGTAEYDPAYAQIIELTNQAYEDALAEASSISEGLRAAMTSAFADGQISNDEYQNILSYMRSYNDAIARAAAEAQSEEDYIKMGKWLKQAQGASLEDIQTLATTATSERDQILADQEDRFQTEYFRAQYRGADAETLARAEALHQQEQMRVNAAYDEFLFTLWDSQIQQSGQGENYAALAGYAQQYMTGELTADTIMSMIKDSMGGSIYAGDAGWEPSLKGTDRAQLGRMMGYMIGSMGGDSGVQERIAYYEGIGDRAMAGRLRQMYAMEQLVNGFGRSMVLEKPAWDILNLSSDYVNTNQDMVNGINRKSTDALLLGGTDYSTEIARRTIAALGDGKGSMSAYFDAVGQSVQEGTVRAISSADLSRGAGRELDNMLTQLSAAYDLERVLADSTSYLAQEGNAYRYDFAMWDLLYGEASSHAEDYKTTVPVEPDFQEGEMPDMEPIAVPIQPRVEGEDAMTSLQDQGVTVDVGADATELTATIDGADGQTLMEYVSGDATNLTMTITDQDGRVLTENVTGNAASLAAIISSYNGRTITVNITGRKLFAEGGRATSASIFGEAGPEWAIPEEHSERTAALLNAAREASGFTWPDILARFGGLNANPSNEPTTIIYSPTINAADATGVDQVLQEDKKRLDKWYEEKKMRDQVEVYS